MNAIVSWIKAARWHASLLHVFEMWLFFVPAWLITGQVKVGAAAVIAWYWSRKQTEIRAAASPGMLIDAWRLGWLPWIWPAPMRLDFAIPTVIAVGVCFIEGNK